ncbi:hypothetical protein HCJ39_05185 [Listeria rocourtiae]|uniref:hypothetical protein n=1 Tax=Listeria rocourtiae TaxID=647910 RepID=UPI001627509A|nr:hypothetical protein [Listeria rocourtiae]MBC1604107.1 hypothetical protein [Listeria rocourtiae]
MKRIAKSMLVLLSAFALTFALIPQVNAEEVSGTNLPSSSEITYDINKNLTEEQVSQRFVEIGTKYKIEEPFSKEDAEFVVHYAKANSDYPQDEPTSPIQARGIHFYKGTDSRSFKKSKTAQGVKVTFSGKVSNHLNSIIPSDQWYSGKTTAKINSGSAKVKSIKTTVSVSSFGFIGSSGTYVGLVHNSSLTSKSGNKATVNYLDKKKKYTALLMVYTNATTYVTVDTTTGSYNLYGF